MKNIHLYILVLLVAFLFTVVNSTSLADSGFEEAYPIGNLFGAAKSSLDLPVANAVVEVNILNYDEQASLLSLHAAYDYSNTDGLLRDFDASSKQNVTNFTYSYEGSGSCQLTSPVSIQCEGNITRIIVSFDYSQTVSGSTVEIGAGINIPGAQINGDVTMTYVPLLLYYSATLEPTVKESGFLRWLGNADNAYGAYVTFNICELVDGSCPITDICSNSNCLVAYYHFNQDNTVNGIVKDFSEFANNGTLHGAQIQCNSAYFDGNGYISIPHTDSLNLIDSFTITAWIMPDTNSSGYIPILTKGNTTSMATPYSIIYHDLSSEIVAHARFASDTATYSADLETDSLNKGLWNFIVWRFENGILQIFNGTTMIEQRNIGFSSLSQNTLPLEIGRDIPGVTEFFKGQMDEIRIYNSALTLEEIKSVYSPMKLPYTRDDQAINETVYWTSGPHGYNQGGNFSGTYPACEGSGIDFATGGNFEVLAVAAGKVIDASCDNARPFGCQVAIKHDFDGSVMIYAHMDSILIYNPYSVKQGQSIGRAGSTGTGTDNIHLHLELRDGSESCETNCVLDKLGGNPLDWGHGPTLIDGYQIYGYQNLNFPTEYFNYDGSAIISDTQKIDGFPFIDNGTYRKNEVRAFVSSSFECDTAVETNCEKNDFHDFTQFAAPGILDPSSGIFMPLFIGENNSLAHLISTNVKYSFDIFLPHVFK